MTTLLKAWLGMTLAAATLTASWPEAAGLHLVHTTVGAANLAVIHRVANTRVSHRDKTGTSGGQAENCCAQVAETKGFPNAVTFEAEGMGFEPTTPCGAPDFESGRWPIRLPSGTDFAASRRRIYCS